SKLILRRQEQLEELNLLVKKKICILNTIPLNNNKKFAVKTGQHHGKVWISDNAIYIKEFKNSDFNLVFLLELMKVIDFSKFADFSGQPKITQKPLENQKYILPPLALQNEFADFVALVDKSQLAIQKSLEELETLKKSLMQEYFG
ncbi:restriction endonuclease subunit S, partial [Streptococcus pneumoniae]|uniref:restriction endonuclease subunit S n=1 Tax=Streptococcus pneumoniae TaxID=1313 RepID=UPI00214D6EA3